MKRFLSVLRATLTTVAVVALFVSIADAANKFKQGDRVKIKSTGEIGVVAVATPVGYGLWNETKTAQLGGQKLWPESDLESATVAGSTPANPGTPPAPPASPGGSPPPSAPPASAGNAGPAASSASVAAMVKLINDYRAGSSHNTNIGSESPDLTLLKSKVGDIRLPTNAALTKSAQETAQKLANGTYSYAAAHHQKDHKAVNGPMVRAIKAGWVPSLNKHYDARTLPPITGIRENLMQGPAGLSPQSALDQWKNSPGHNFALLKAQARSMGVGHAEGNGQSYSVFLVESDAHMDYAPGNAGYFQFNQIYKIKPGANPGQPIDQVFEISQAVIDKIKAER